MYNIEHITTWIQRIWMSGLCQKAFIPPPSQSQIKPCCSIFSMHYYISGTNRQNPFPLYLVKLRNRALKFLVHFSLVCLGKYPKAHEKWYQTEKPIWGSISHPSGMLWRPFRGRFLQILQPKGFSEAYFSVFPAFMKRLNPFPLHKSGNYNGKEFSGFVP